VIKTTTCRFDWSIEEIAGIHQLPLVDLIFRAAAVHREYHDPREVQVCSLLSIKTGGCSEDCSSCSQSAHYDAGVESTGLIAGEEVRQAAQLAKQNGATRFCMGAAWRQVRSERDFARVLDIVRSVRELDLEVCCTLGMLTEDQARRLKEAGLTSYNHNLDTGASFYGNVVSTHTFADRLKTLRHVRAAGISLCCGGILGLGESPSQRLELLQTLASLDPHPESVPINALVPIPGTPLAEQTPVPAWEMIRTIATARIVMPASMVRLAAGRLNMTTEAQTLCFLAGANSIFSGDRLLTTPNLDGDTDRAMFELLGLRPRMAFKQV
jgi:biotin synthase